MAKVLSVRISVEIHQEYQGSLRISDEFTIKEMDFKEMCKVIGQFEDLATRVKKENNIA